MSHAVEPCPTCPEGWRPLDKEHCADCYEGRIERLRAALESILAMHDGNQPPALNMPDLDYARRVIRDIHFKARDALSRC